MGFPNQLCRKILTLLVLFLCSLACTAADQYPKHPLNERVVVALIAGSSLPLHKAERVNTSETSTCSEEIEINCFVQSERDLK